ncbi:hypothetical protein D5S17_24525 [Pseudonocardiaceae bacterium YIM PH 21723]|nr:hypothetical protein D5S17_24525 [Pseudonocardiaceae bacterium YIM PH 21723]
MTVPYTTSAPLRRVLRSWLVADRPALVFAITGAVLGLALLATMAIHGPRIGQEGDLYRAGIFDIAVGIAILNLIIFLRLAGFGRRWATGLRVFLILAGYLSYLEETVPTLLGHDPRVGDDRPAFLVIASTGFGLLAIGLVISFVTIAIKFLTSRTRVRDPAVLTGIRYAVSATVLAGLVGMAMAADQGSGIGQRGDLLPLHALGFHGLQVIPVISLLAVWSGAGRLLPHVAGIAYLTLCAAVGVQSFSGLPVFQPSVATLVAGVATLTLLGCLAYGLHRWRKAGCPAESGALEATTVAV